MMDKAFWQQIVANGYTVPEDAAINDLVDALVSYLASPEPEWRDDIGYSTLAQWILQQKIVPEDKLRQMMPYLIGNLKKGIGEQDNDGVFLRSFSMLILGIIVYRDNEAPFLNRGDIEAVQFAALEYLREEKDLRGYVPGMGWAHALAHTADTLKFLTRNPHTTADDHWRVLAAVADKFDDPTVLYFQFDEDERTALLLTEIVKRELLSLDALIGWANGLVQWKKQMQGDEFDPTVFVTHQNIKNLLRSFYFQLVKLDNAPPDEFIDAVPILKNVIYKAVRAFNF